MFELEYTRVEVPVQLVGRQRYVDVPHWKNRPGVVIQQLKSMAKRNRGGGLIIHSRTLRDSAKVAPKMGEVEEYAEGNLPVKVKECPVGPEILYIAFPVAKSKVEVWLHMELGIVPMGWSYELFQEFLDMQKGAGCNSVTLWAIGPPTGGFSLKEGSLVSKDSKNMSEFPIWSLV